MIRSTSPFSNISQAVETAMWVFPVPAGPMPNAMSLVRHAAR
jgi:hypothetical protein